MKQLQNDTNDYEEYRRYTNRLIMQAFGIPGWLIGVEPQHTSYARAQNNHDTFVALMKAKYPWGG